MTTPNMSLVLPTDHGSSDTWDVILDAVFGLVDAHDHTTGKGVKIPSAALKINADVSWSFGGTNYAITDAKAIDFAAVAAANVTGLSGALFVNSADNELYYRTTAGVNVKFTNGAALNVAAFTGGIGGDYSAIGALVDFDDASDTYRFRQQVATLVRQFAKMSSADLNLFEYKAAGATPVPANAVTLKSPVGLAAGYSVTFPAAVPGVTSLLQMTAAGALLVGNVLANALTASDFHFSAGRTLSLPAVMGSEVGGAAHTKTAFYWQTGASSDVIAVPIPCESGCTISAWTLFINKTSNAGTTITAQLVQGDSSAGTAANIGTADTNNANNPGFTTMGKTGLAGVAIAGKFFELQITPTTGTAGDRFYQLDVLYTR